ncbi:hypothetical protein U9M48_026058 [Paspalum notatum var. saurae]|uniref:DUF4218 domain-containing protein n=1 Tax=Paspalum notatum var. saurae TaxID=547442 RepID=A0AAQ3TRG3_PASNO
MEEKKDYDGKIENREKPQEFSAAELRQQLENVKDVKPGKHPQSKKRKRDTNDGQCWKKRLCLWDLPYWIDLKLRHNLDVMHIEKNICESLLGTFLALPGKSKDSINARLDFEDMGIRKDLHLKHDGDSLYDGYASNLASCITADGCNLQGLKTHDCHIILQRILLAALRGIMHNEIYVAIAELGNFFQQLCARTLKLDVLRQMKDNIPIILCKLEKIFPPSLFDVMLHLSIHLPDEAILRGPVQYGWMYPVERRLYTLKHSVRNMARPEGSIAEAYVANECLHACSRYFDDLETRHNREGRNREHLDTSEGDISVFQHGVDLLGAPRITYLEKDYDKMVWYVLNNCPEVEPFIEYIGALRYVRGEDISDDLFALSCEPDLRIRVYSACIVDGVRYHTVDREKNRRTQNSGVMAEGTHNGEDIEFYGCLREIIQLQYNADSTGHRSVVIFRCDWFDTESKKGRLKDDGLFKSINHSCFWYKNDPFILAPQATMVFYLQDTKFGGNWRVVQKFAHRHLWNIDETSGDEIPKDVTLSYQDDECVASNIQHTEVILNNVTAGVENGVIIDASVVEDLHRQREVEGMQNYFEDEEDETYWQYASDNDERTIPNDVDDDSDDD